MQDARELTLGMWIDYIIEYNNMHREAWDREKGTSGDGGRVVRRKATQADFDAF